MDNRAGEMMVFVRVVEAGSFSEAARLLRMSASTVSKLVARIEQRLGTRLVERSTRHLVLTKEGELYYERSQAVLAQITEVESQLARGGSQPDGTVRVNASVSFGVRGLEPLLPAFWKAYPKIAIDLSLNDDIVDLYLDRTDVAFRVGRLQASTLLARKVGISRRVIVGSPAYLAKRGTPLNTDDLASHTCLGFNFRRSTPVWPARESLFLANNGETVGRLALAGVGLARLGDYHVRDFVARGELVEVLADSADTEEIHAVYPGGPHMPQRVRVFLDFVVPRLQKFLSRSASARRD